jgi:hypothetical protein
MKALDGKKMIGSIHNPCAVTVQKQERRQPKQKQNNAHKNNQQTKQQKTSQHGWWSADQFIVLAMYKKDDNVVSPRDWYGKGKTNNKTTRPQLCHTEICEPGINKSTMRKPRLPPARSLEITKCSRTGNILTDC